MNNGVKGTPGGYTSSGNSARSAPLLEVRELNVFYGASHALQGVNLTLQSGVLSVVGRNGMGKTTLCKAIMGLVPSSSGSIRFAGRELRGMLPADLVRLGIGYVPQGRRLWRSLTVDEHLRMIGGKGSWTPDRVYATFPRLAERKDNGGGQLSGGEQQMLAIARALLLNPRLLVMDEPTEGLAPVIVNQVEEMLIRLAAEGDMDVLVIEQNIGVATAVSEQVAIMVNGQVNRIVDAGRLASDRALQQRLLGVGRHSDAEGADNNANEVEASKAEENASNGIDAVVQNTPQRVYQSNPSIPHRWSKPVSSLLIERSARTLTGALNSSDEGFTGTGVSTELHALSASSRPVVIVAGTLDTKGAELRFIRDAIVAHNLPVQLVDLSTSGEHSGADVPAHQVAAFHPRGSSGVFTGDRGASVAAMSLAFERWIKRQSQVLGMIGAAGSGGSAMVAPAMRSVGFGIPKVLISTVASGEVSHYVGPSDIMMLHSVADVQGLNSITREVLTNGAQALAGMVMARATPAAKTARMLASSSAQPALGITMFGVTTACVQQLTQALDTDYDCLVFHATGIGGQSMESLIDNGRISAVLDMTTTEVCDKLIGGVFPASDDRFGAIIRARMPYVGACGALDMVNFGARHTVPEAFSNRNLYEHNPQVTLMRTTQEENAEIGHWIGNRLNQMDGPVRFFLPEGGVSALDKPGQAFHDPAANKALFEALHDTVRQTAQRQLVTSPHHINDAAFVSEVLHTFHDINGPVRKMKHSNRKQV